MTAASRHFQRSLVAIACVVLSAGHAPVRAATIPTDVEDLQVRWDNTVKYSVGQRLSDPMDVLTTDANQDDGDLAFKKGGLMTNRFDLLSELDITYKNFGFRASGAAWYDFVYNRNNDYQGYTYNPLSVPTGVFTEATRNLQGRYAEWLDALVFGRNNIEDMTLTWRLGRHSVLYGESLFYGVNGIAAAQAPIDVIKLLSVPGTQFKELMRPLNQISGQLQITQDLTFGAYYQLQWMKDRLPAAQSYFSSTDILDTGGERFFTGPGMWLTRGDDTPAKNSGQGGAQLKYRSSALDAEFGLYAARYHSRSPRVLMSFQTGNYSLFYPEGIRTLGASASTTFLDANVAAEVSFRDNMPLIPTAGAVPDTSLLPVGKTAHAQVSWVYVMSASPLWDGGSFIGEVAYHRITSVTANEAMLDPNGTRDASAVRVLFTPTYYQVLPGLDLSVPVGTGYGLSGRSLVIPNFAPFHGGDYSVGLAGEYQKEWRISLTYNGYYGSAAGITIPPNSPQPYNSYLQTLRDRNYIVLSVARTF